MRCCRGSVTVPVIHWVWQGGKAEGRAGDDDSEDEDGDGAEDEDGDEDDEDD